MHMTTRPLADRWPKDREKTKESARKWTPFRASYGQTLRQLDVEIDHLGGHSVVMMVDVREQDLRLDGAIRANAPQPRFPGVGIAFESEHGPMEFFCDACRQWQDNVRAITLTLERLRKAELYGVTSRGEQYTGWVALEAADPDVAWEFIGKWSDTSVEDMKADAAVAQRALLKARVATHPDRLGHDDLFSQVNANAQLVGLT